MLQRRALVCRRPLKVGSKPGDPRRISHRRRSPSPQSRVKTKIGEEDGEQRGVSPSPQSRVKTALRAEVLSRVGESPSPQCRVKTVTIATREQSVHNLSPSPQSRVKTAWVAIVRITTQEPSPSPQSRVKTCSRGSRFHGDTRVAVPSKSGQNQSAGVGGNCRKMVAVPSKSGQNHQRSGGRNDTGRWSRRPLKVGSKHSQKHLM